MSDRLEQEIIGSWQSNALPWARAVRDNRIESRMAVTNGAIVKTVVDECRAANLQSVLDIGCGEGWLVRELNRQGLVASGVDAIDELIAQARELDPENSGRYRTLAYDELARGELKMRFDLVVANFSLLGDESVRQLFAATENMLNPGGRLVVQTIHPVIACGDQPYEDGWREESWRQFGEEFKAPAPWFFRTMESWITLFTENNLTLVKISEPLHPEHGKPASIIFVGAVN